MEFTPRRILLFLIFSALVLLSWKNFVVEPMQEAQKRQAERQRLAEAEKAAEEESKKDDSTKTKKAPAGVNGPAVAEKPGEIAQVKPEKAAAPEPPKPGKPERHPKQEVALGSLEPDSGYFFKVWLTSTGAAVARIELNDPRYRDLDDPETPLALIQPVNEYATFQTTFYEIAKKGGKEVRKSILGDSVNWKVVKPKKPDPTKVIFEYVIPQEYRFVKEYTLKPAADSSPTKEQRDTLASGYFLHLAVTVENLQDDDAVVQYELQGPVGMPLENAESTRKFRDIKIGAVGDGEIIDRSLTVKDLTKTINKGNDVEKWAAPYRYVGIDGQFFAALLYNPPDKGPTTEKIATYIPEVLRMDTEESQHSDISVLLKSNPIELEPAYKKSDEYTLFAGPKRQALLDTMEAGDILEFGWFGWISKGMLAIMSFLHNTLLFPYGLAIIGLTILVRGALFPLSKKQAHSAKRMKELQPRIQELKKKYGDDKQAFAQAQWDLFKKAGYNPFAGCLPMLLQLPIFIGLYSALNHAVDLRAVSFLWVDDLASPDKLFKWPGGFRLPFLGHYFNLLPLLTVGLFLVQQKMFMPAPDPDDEQAQMQHKVMNFMMIFMGFLFYHVPAGLCIYFIASSLWSVGERKLLDYGKSDKGDAADGDQAETSKSFGGFKSLGQNGQKKGSNVASKKRGKKSKTRR